MDDRMIGVLRSHIGGVQSDGTDDAFATKRYLTNLGLLDSYTDYRTGCEVVFTTNSGLRCMRQHDDHMTLRRPMDYIDSGRSLEGDEYRDLLREAAEVGRRGRLPIS